MSEPRYGEPGYKTSYQNLVAENASLRARVDEQDRALEAWADDFKRDIASGNFVSEDRHEAMRLTDASLSPAVPVPPERKEEACCGSCSDCNPPPQKPEEGGAR